MQAVPKAWGKPGFAHSPVPILTLRRQIISLNMKSSCRRTKATSIKLKDLTLLSIAYAFTILLHTVNDYNYTA